MIPSTAIGYHDQELTGVQYDREYRRLTLSFQSAEVLCFSDVVQFELNFFSDQNVLFSINEYALDDVPPAVLEDYPFLASYRQHSQAVYIYHVIPSVGLEGVIVTSERASLYASCEP